MPFFFTLGQDADQTEESSTTSASIHSVNSLPNQRPQDEYFLWCGRSLMRKTRELETQSWRQHVRDHWVEAAAGRSSSPWSRKEDKERKPLSEEEENLMQRLTFPFPFVHHESHLKLSASTRRRRKRRALSLDEIASQP